VKELAGKFFAFKKMQAALASENLLESMICGGHREFFRRNSLGAIRLNPSFSGSV